MLAASTTLLSQDLARELLCIKRNFALQGRIVWDYCTIELCPACESTWQGVCGRDQNR